MHEFSICRSLLAQVAAIAESHGAHAVVSLTVGVGPLSGVEPGLLDRAFSLARLGTVAEGAALRFETPAITVRCRSCASVSTAAANRLICAQCGDWRTELISGDELLLMSVELERSDDDETDVAASDAAADTGPLAPRAAVDA